MHVSAVHEYPLPQIKPPLGLLAVPLPKKIRTKSAIGLLVAAATAAAAGPLTGFTGAPVDDAAAALAAPEEPPCNSRRLNATADHANGNAAGPSPEPPPANQDNKS